MAESAESAETKKIVDPRVEIDTSPPFESVKEAVDRFGGSGPWIPHHLLRLAAAHVIKFSLLLFFFFLYFSCFFVFSLFFMLLCFLLFFMFSDNFMHLCQCLFCPLIYVFMRLCFCLSFSNLCRLRRNQRVGLNSNTAVEVANRSTSIL